MNGEMEEIKQAVERYRKETKLKKAELLGIKFITSEKGAGLLNELSRVFDLVDVPCKRENVEIMHAEHDTQNAEALGNLTFIDGVLITWNIFIKILDNRLRDENGDPEKDDIGHNFLGIINDDVTDLLLNKVLENGYFKSRGKELAHLFEV